MVARREQELRLLNGEPAEQFDKFKKTAKGRDDEGALRDTTTIKLEWKHGATLLRLDWSAKASANWQGAMVEQYGGDAYPGWHTSDSQSIKSVFTIFSAAKRERRDEQIAGWC
ncbi:MAG: hypothetical protein HC848_09910 [Limnobacter sp.]|nr:hypothetical protein [Limnobacter sp.]